jgi:hypothetical protein
MVPAVIAIAFILALCSSGASAKYHADDKTVPAAAPSQSEPGSSLFQHGTGRSFVVTARAGASSKSQMSEPMSSLLLGDSEEDFEDELVTGVPKKRTALTSTLSDDSAFYLGVCLDVLVFLIIIDGVRRYCGTGTKEAAQPDSQPFNAQHGVSRALLTQQPRCSGSQAAKDAADAAAKLHEAVRAGDIAQCAAILDEAGPFMTRRILGEADLWGCNALHLAANSGSSEIVSILLERGGSGARVNAVDAWDQTPLHFAARSGSVAVCRILLDRGASVDAIDAQEFTALHVAAKLGHEAMCEFLLERGAGLGSTADANVPPILSALLVKRMFAPKATSKAD